MQQPRSSAASNTRSLPIGAQKSAYYPARNLRKHASISIAGVFLIIAGAIFVTASAESKNNNPQQPQSSPIHKSDPSSAPKNESKTTTGSGPPPDTTVTVNGQSVPVPAQGSTSQTITHDSGTTTVNISHHSSTQASSGTSTSNTDSFSLHVDSSSSASSESNQ